LPIFYGEILKFAPKNRAKKSRHRFFYGEILGEGNFSAFMHLNEKDLQKIKAKKSKWSR
jgi:hypothetical protein